MRQREDSPAAGVQAANILLDRGWGKPRQRRWSSVIDLELALERIARGRVGFLAVARRLI